MEAFLSQHRLSFLSCAISFDVVLCSVSVGVLLFCGKLHVSMFARTQLPSSNQSDPSRKVSVSAIGGTLFVLCICADLEYWQPIRSTMCGTPHKMSAIGIEKYIHEWLCAHRITWTTEVEFNSPQEAGYNKLQEVAKGGQHPVGLQCGKIRQNVVPPKRLLLVAELLGWRRSLIFYRVF